MDTKTFETLFIEFVEKYSEELSIEMVEDLLKLNDQVLKESHVQ